MRRAQKVTASNIRITVTMGNEQETTISLMSTTEAEADTITVATPMRIGCTGKRQPFNKCTVCVVL